jgi:hypothetical protein
MTNLGNMKYFLGIEFHESKDGIFISQSKYAHDIFKRFNMMNSKEAVIPLFPSVFKYKDNSPRDSGRLDMCECLI